MFRVYTVPVPADATALIRLPNDCKNRSAISSQDQNPSSQRARLVATRRAALDLFETEPLRDPDDPLLQLDNVVCIPHLGYVTREEFDLQFSHVFDQIMGIRSGWPWILISAPG
jgi:hypothetical protein